MPLKGKTIFITGGTGGIGRPLVRVMEQAGATVAVYDRSKQGDLAAHIDDLCAALAYGTPDILINMAGFSQFSFCEDQNVRALIDTDLYAAIRLSQAVLPGMKRRGHGQIVNIGSMVGLIPLPHMTVYAAAKAGLKAFSDSLRRELSGTGIAVTHIAPRAVRTDANHGLAAILNSRTKTTEDDPQVIARVIFDAIAARKADIRIGWPERAFAALNLLLPAFVDRGLQKHRIIGEALLNSQKKHQGEKNETHTSYLLSVASGDGTVLRTNGRANRTAGRPVGPGRADHLSAK